MTLTGALTQEKFQEILTTIYLKGQESEHINISELIEEIKQQVVADR